MKNLPGIFLLMLLLLCTNNCSSTVYDYKPHDEKSLMRVSVPVGKTKAALGFGVAANNALPLVERDYPTINASYTAPLETADGLQKLEAKLFVDGKEIAADETTISAYYGIKYVEIAESECCANISRKLEIDPAHLNKDFSLRVSVSKTYKSLKRLPQQVTITVLILTDKGQISLARDLTLSSHESNGPWIRVH